MCWEAVVKARMVAVIGLLVAMAVGGLATGCSTIEVTVSTSTASTSIYVQQALDSPPAQAVGTSSIDGPLRVSTVNPRYFTNDSGKGVYLCGTHTWLDLQDGGLTDPASTFDYREWLDFLEAHNLNFFRLWTWEQAKWVVEWGEAYYFTPLPYQRTGPGTALDGKPKFDLTKFNQEYFDRLRARVIAAGERGIYVSVMLFNGWSVSYPKGQYDQANPWLGHPFNKSNNTNGVNGDPNGDESGAEIEQLPSRSPALLPSYTSYQEAYVKKVIDTVNDLDNVLYEIANESNGGPEEIAWQYHMIDLIHEYEGGKPEQHPVGMTSAWPEGENSQLLDSPAEWISPNGAGKGLDYPAIADGTKVVVSDTDHLVGIGGNRAWVWKAFTRGENLLFMDQYDDGYQLDGGGYDMNNPNDVSMRLNLGFTRTYAHRMDLLTMKPHGELSSTGYALANPVEVGGEYLVYAPTGGSVTIDLTGTSGALSVEWLDPNTGVTYSGGMTAGGAPRTLSPPFQGDSVLYLVADGEPPTSTTSTTDPQSTTTTVTGSPTFSDVPFSHPYYSQIGALAALGIVGGYGDGTFGPDQPLLRQQFAKMVVGTLGLPVSVNDICYFTDVGSNLDAGDPLYPNHYVAVCADHGITLGKTPTTFDPYGKLSRAQLITMIARAADLPEPPADYVPVFREFSEVHYPWARKAAYAGLLEGLQSIGSGYDFWASASRGEVSVLLYDLLRG